MSCKICGRSACTESFHSLEEQEEWDNKIGNSIDNVKSTIENRVNRIVGEYIDDVYYVKLDDVINAINY